MKTDLSCISDVKSLNFNKYDKQNLFTILEKYISFDNKILLAISGGSDSMMLACIVYLFFYTKKYPLKNLFIVHCNHKIRKESDDEESFIKNFFGEIKNNLIICKYTKTSHTEDNLRKRRYSEFLKIIKQNKIKYLLLGHHLNDRVESTFLNLLRGSDLKGFISMKEFGTHHLLDKHIVIRPLLGITKQYISLFCKDNNIPFVQDQSNFDSSISKRNYIRNEILPKIFEQSNKISQTSNSFLDSFGNIYSSIEKCIKSDFSLDYHIKQGIIKKISVCKYRNSEFAYQLINFKKIGNDKKDKIDLLILILKELGLNKNITKKNINIFVDFLLEKNNGFKYFNGTYFFVSHGKIYIIKANRKFYNNDNKLSNIKQIISKNELSNIGNNTNGKKYIKFDGYKLKFPDSFSLENNGIIIRYPKIGDYFKGKTLNKWFINQKIPVFWRNFIPLIEVDGKIKFVFSNICDDKIGQVE